ncbi:MAG: LOG family protein [Anaerolineae bacterium]|nr:MAG: LOG family protein [Anaerolineae bacterium]
MVEENLRPIVAVFGAHTPEPGSPAYREAAEVGALLARAGFTVSNGGYSGTMAAVSEGASGEGGKVIGVTSVQIESYRSASINPWVTKEIIYKSLQERIFHLVRENDAMIVLPGGIGTLTELAFAWNLMQVSELPYRPLVLMGEMWRETLAAFVQPEYVALENQEMIHFADTPKEAVEIVSQWIQRKP